MVYLQYVGKKLPFKFENPNIKADLDFTDRGQVVSVSDADAEWIFKHNPDGFVKKIEPQRMHSFSMVQKRVSGDDEPEKEPEGPKKTYHCPHCFKEYVDEMWFNRHVEKCMNPEKDE